MYIILLFIFELCSSEIISTNVDMSLENVGSASLIDKGLVFFAGGLARYVDGPETNVKNINIYNINTNQWTTSQLSLGRFEVAGASLNKKGLVFFAGGAYLPNGDKTQNQLLTNIVDIYNANTNTWSVQTLSQNRSGITATSLDNQNLVFFAGGYITVNLGNPEFTTNRIDIYNATSNSWSISSLHIKNSFVYATSLHSCGLAFMGGAFQKILSVYNASSNSWSEMSLSLDTNFGASVNLESYGLVMFAGGATQQNIFSNIVDIYDAKTDTWSKLYLSIARAALGGAALDKYGLVFFAGGMDQNQQHNIVDILDIKTMTWSISYLKSKRAFIGSAILNDLAFFAGGYSAIDAIGGIDIFAFCKNSFSSINPLQCNECPAGYFCNYQIVPIICPTGTYCGINISKPILCPSGTYNDVIGKISVSDCKKCPIGTYNSNLGISSVDNCSPCQIGTYCQEGSIFSLPCPENYFCPIPAIKTPCPAGTYLDETFATSAQRCKKCIKGHSCDGKGGSPVPCSPGLFSKEEGTAKCETCPAGFSCPFGSIEPAVCEKNYIAKKGSSACTSCPSGTYTNGEGETDCIACAGNQFDASGWWCMSSFERVLFIGVWGGTFLSVYATIKKVYQFITERLRKIREAGLSFTWRRFIFIKSIEERIPNFEMSPQISQPVEMQIGKYNERSQYLPADKSLSIERRPRRHYERDIGYERGSGINFERGTGLYLKEDSPVLQTKTNNYSPLHLPKDNVVLDLYLDQINIEAQQTSNLSQRENENILSENISAPQGSQGSQDTLNVSNIGRNVQLHRSRTMRQPPSLANIPRKSQMNLKKNIII